MALSRAKQLEIALNRIVPVDSTGTLSFISTGGAGVDSNAIIGIINNIVDSAYIESIVTTAPVSTIDGGSPSTTSFVTVYDGGTP